MNRILSTLPLLALVTLASAQNTKAIAEKNLAAERSATLKGDVAWFDRTMAPDYYEIDRRGKRKARENVLSEMRLMFKTLKIKALTVKVQSVQTVGQTTLVMVEAHLVGALTERGKRFEIDTLSNSVEAWKQIGGEWRMASQKTTSEKMKVNGKPVG